MSKYQTEAGIECTPEECKLIDSLKCLAKKWKKDGKRLWLYSASGTLHVMIHGDTEDNPTPEFTQCMVSNEIQRHGDYSMIRNLCREIIKEEITDRLSIDISLKKKEG